MEPFHLVFFAGSESGGFPFGVGPAWVEAVSSVREAIRAWGGDVVSRAAGLTNLPAIQSVFDSEGVHTVRCRTFKTGIERIKGWVPPDRPAVLVNPFYGNIGLKEAQEAIRVWSRRGPMVATVAPPRVHPTLLAGWGWLPDTQNQMQETLIRWVRSSVWLRSGASLFIKQPGKRLVVRKKAIDGVVRDRPTNCTVHAFQRQNFPPVLELCNGLFVLAPQEISALGERLRTGEFTPMELSPDKALDFSHRLQYVDALRLRRREEQAEAARSMGAAQPFSEATA